MKKDDVTRKCIVNGNILPKSEMLRFTMIPGGIIVPDFKKRLPGKGIWMTNSKKVLETAIKKNLFSKVIKKNLKADETLIELVEWLLKEKALSQISLARKAGVFVAGFDKVAEKIKKESVLFILEASDAAIDGHKKMLAIAKNLKVFNSFTTEELDKELDKVNTVHAAFLKSEMAKAVYFDINKYETFINS